MKSRISPKESMILRFMERTIENINTCLAGQYTLYKILIEKKIVTEQELLSRIKEDKNLPQRKLGIQVLEDMLSPDWEDNIDFEVTEKILFQRALDKIMNLKLPESWKKEGVEKPNSTAMRNAYKICHILFNSKKLIPRTVACTKENGIFLTFVEGDKSLIVELYNDGEIGSIVTNDKKKEILQSEDILNYNFDCQLEILYKK